MFGFLLALNTLGSTDIVFFVVLAVLVALCIGVYFLIPLLNKKQYSEMRENLKKREAAFKTNVKRTDGTPSASDDISDKQESEQGEAPCDGLPTETTSDEEE